MQPCTPPRKITCCVNGHGVTTVPGRHSHHSKQFDGQLSLSATNTCPHRSIDASMRFFGSSRSLALDHGLVYPHPTGGQNHPRSRQNSAARSAPAAGSAGMSHRWMGAFNKQFFHIYDICRFSARPAQSRNTQQLIVIRVGNGAGEQCGARDVEI